MKNRVSKMMFGCVGLALFSLIGGAFVSCSTFPVMAADGKGVSYSMLGYVGPAYATYEAAFKEARQKYPNADAVVVVKGHASDNIIGSVVTFGYYAVKFVENTVAPRKKFLGIF